MASITAYTFLMSKGASDQAYSLVYPIKDYPDVLAPRESVESTTLSNKGRTYEPGLINTPGSLDFTMNMETEAFTALDAIVDTERDFAVFFGGTDPLTPGGDPTPTGDLCKVGGKGVLTYSISGKGVGDIREIVAHIAPTTDWTVFD